MKITLSVIKADIGSIGGHIKPSSNLLAAVQDHVKSKSKGVFIDHKISYTGDDIAILSTHANGPLNEKVHRICWEAFLAGGKIAQSQGLYGAKQDLLKQDFKGSVKGMGPAVAELEFEERPAEPFLFFAADKTNPGAFNMPAYLSFCDPMHNAGLLLSSKLRKGFIFRILDAGYTEADRIIELSTPEDIYDIAVLLRDTERFFVEGIYSRASGEQIASFSTTRLRNIAGKYTGKDDPVMLVRTQKDFPGTGEVLSPYNIGAFVAGFMRGSHNGPLMPIRQNSDISFFDGPPVVSAAAYCVHDGKLTEAADAFDHPYWDHVRTRVSQKAEEIRKQGFFGSAMLPYSELEYGGIVEVLQELDKRFIIKK